MTTINDALALAQADFAAQHATSKTLHDRACQVMPGGNTRTVLFMSPFPIRIAQASP